MQYDGWTLRFANGVTKRSNSVSLLYPSTLDPEEKINFCEQCYLSQNITPCFKITPAAEPADMDQRLYSRGYFIHSIISFQTMDISRIQPEPLHEIHIETELKPGWIEDFIWMNEFEPARTSTYMDIMKQIRLQKCLISLKRDHQTIGVGLGILEDGFIGLFDIVVDKNYRNSGLGYLIVENILRWGRNNGAEKAYLQVLNDNSPAISLYKKMGFNEVYQYWYRMKR